MKYAIITSDNYFSYLILSELLVEHHDKISIIIDVRRTSMGGSTLSVLRRILATSGFRLFCYKAGTAAYTCILNRGASIAPKLFPPFGPVAHARRLGIKVATLASVNSRGCLELLSSVRPERIVAINVYQQLKEPILRLASEGVIGVHLGMLPRFRGMSPYMWAMAHGEAQIGVTAYFMDEGIDTGDIIVQEPVKILPGDSVYALYVRGCLRARRILKDIADVSANDGLPRRPQLRTASSYFSMPGRECVDHIRQRGYALVRFRDLLRVTRSVLPSVLRRFFDDGNGEVLDR